MDRQLIREIVRDELAIILLESLQTKNKFDDITDFSEYLKSQRGTNGFKTRKQLSLASGVSEATISRLEAGCQRPSFDTFRKLQRCFKS